MRQEGAIAIFRKAYTTTLPYLRCIIGGIERTYPFVYKFPAGRRGYLVTIASHTSIERHGIRQKRRKNTRVWCAPCLPKRARAELLRTAACGQR